MIYYESSSEIKQFNNTYSLIDLVIDNDDNGEGDVFRLNMDLYARKNGGKWYLAEEGFTITVNGYNIIDDDLPLNVENNDVVDFELRDGL